MTLPRWWSKTISELERFARVLNSIEATERLSLDLLASIGAVRASAYIVQVDDCGQRYRGIRFPPLSIIPPISNQLLPIGARLRSATVEITYECYEKGAGRFGNEDLDRIRRADFQVCVRGIVAFGNVTIDLEDHWRVDTHHFSGTSTEPHPWIHYQRGGHAQEAFVSVRGFVPGVCLDDAIFNPVTSLRGLMQTPAPRVAAPPMDPICAIDFVIAQHNGSVWSSLWSFPEYDALVRRAQDRLWQPYFSLVLDRQHRGALMPFFGAPKPRDLAAT
jgi:hypothetical protein